MGLLHVGPDDDLRMNSMGMLLAVKACFTVKNQMEISNMLKRIIWRRLWN